jgi:hypothetical protein
MPKTTGPAVTAWEVIDKVAPYSTNQHRFRLRVTYVHGHTRVLPPSFKDRASLDRYVERFHSEWLGKEQIVANREMIDPQ